MDANDVYKSMSLRVSDFSSLPKRMLAPIEGYENAPLVSIEDAVKPLVKIVPKVERNVHIIKQNCKNPADGLTTDESASIMLYTLHIIQVKETDPTYLLLEPVPVSPKKSSVIFDVIWLDANVDDKAIRITEQKLASNINRFKKFQDGAKCQKYIEGRSEKDRLVMIVSGQLGREIVPSVHNLQQVMSIYVYCMNKEINEKWASKYTKVKAVVVQLDELISRIMTDHNIKKTIEGPLSTNSVTARAEAGKLDNVVDDEALKLAKHEIIRALDLEEHETKDEIINDLLENGLRSLSKYEEELLPYIYAAALNEKDGKLRKSLKKYIELQWKIKYGLSNQWFMKFLEDHKDTVNYNSVLNRTAIYGNKWENKWLKDFPILSIVLQLLFEGIDDKFFDETNAFNDLWHTITDGGLKSIEKFSNYMNESTMLKLINKKQPVLFQALREYYRPKLFKLLEKSQIPDKDNFYEVALDSVAEYANAYKMQGKLDLIEYLGSFYPFDTKILLQ
ncbi:unnamed protein product [Rotaria sordida]|uniref:Uncharacterized protein n=1 Tax=Rotaria sordida TaxID=392033 RepID=A0A815W9Y8_9BILA|nr:unnamed protein product [Rotaria sordida]CAF1540556.1 unnamed protein product [Rotaria sordida]